MSNNHVESDQMGHKPTHKVFFAQDLSGSEKPFWRQIGVAWAHKSGRGYQIKLDLVPTDFSSGNIVVLEESEKPENLDQAA